MKKFLLVILVTFSFGSLSFGQDFTFDELVKMRTSPYPSFETYVHDRGYKLDHLENGERCTVFRNGSNVVSYCHHYDDGFSYKDHVGIKFETSSSELYEKLKRSIESTMTYHKTKLRRFTRHHYMEHIYVNDNVVVHVYDIAYKDDPKPYYEIEIFSIYSGKDGSSRWERW